MNYVIIGAGVAGIEAAKSIRGQDSSGEIVMISADLHVHSRCMLHKFISGERDEMGLDFTEKDFFDKYRADSYIPPVGELRKASNVFGLRNLSDAQAIVKEAETAQNVLVIGSGLVGLDASYGLLELGKKLTVVEMADRILPVQLDARAARAYQDRFENAGVRFVLERKASQAVCEPDGRIHKVILDNGEEIPCDLIIVAAGVRSSLGCLEGSGIACERGITVDPSMKTSRKDVFAAGDITALSGIWPNAADQGRVAGKSMCGLTAEYTDTYAMKNTMNFFGLVTLCVGRIREEEGDQVLVREDMRQYKKILLKNGKVEGILFQGDIAGGGIWQYLIKNKIDVSGIDKDVFDINYGDFYHVGDRGKYEWVV